MLKLARVPINIKDWSGERMVDFKRDRRKDEKNARVAGGLPLNDERHNLKKAHGSDRRAIHWLYG